MAISMLTRVDSCPEGVTVFIPDSLAAQVGLQVGTTAHLELSGDRLLIQGNPPGRLAGLLAGITPENIHSEWQTGPAVGKEVW